MRPLATAITLAVLSCTQPTPRPDPDPPEVLGLCASECERGLELGCDWASDQEGPDGKLGTDDDLTCVGLCELVIANGGIWAEGAGCHHSP